MQRRDVLKVALLVPVAAILPKLVFAADAVPANALGESEPMPSALKYKADATKAGPMRTDQKAICGNCAKFNKCAATDKTCKPAKKGAAFAPCEIFEGKVVAKGGWCLSYVKA